MGMIPLPELVLLPYRHSARGLRYVYRTEGRRKRHWGHGSSGRRTGTCFHYPQFEHSVGIGFRVAKVSSADLPFVMPNPREDSWI